VRERGRPKSDLLHKIVTTLCWRKDKMAETWGYSRENGPNKWHLWFPLAVQGRMQSPVDIESTACETVAGENWKKLSASFSPTALLE